MAVDRAHIGHQTRYRLRDDAGQGCELVFDAGEDGHGPITWKILLPGRDGTEDLYSVRQFPEPDARQLTAWLTPFVGQDAAIELAAAVDDGPPPAAAWRPRGGSAPGDKSETPRSADD